jgi:hypothetical protein
MLDADFEIVDAPDLVDALRELARRYQRAVDSASNPPRLATRAPDLGGRST